MRPYQRVAVLLINQDAVSGNAPVSVQQAIERYAERMGPALFFDTGEGWADDIRSAALWTLFKYGYAKGDAVILGNDGSLSSWTADDVTLAAAAAIETDFAGSKALANRAKDIVRAAEVIGEGSKAVYVYTDSRLDSLGDVCTKIGRHNRSGRGEVLQRILQQYGTGNPGYPILRAIVRTDSDIKLETFLHQQFRNQRISNGFGAEWFEVASGDVIDSINDFLKTVEGKPET